MTNDATTFYERPKNDPRDLIDVEVGDSKQAEFLPQKKISRWGNEVNLSVRLIDHGETQPVVEEIGGRVKWRGAKREAHFYELPTSDLLPEGGTEVEIFLLEKPLTNAVRFSLNTKGLRFFEQPALTQSEIDRGEIRPPHVVGSFAVYCDTPKTNLTNGNLYRSGKVGHIYRPWIVDANGRGVWGNLNIDTVRGFLTVRIPQTFLDSAAYPIRHAAGLTFGYTSVGASGYSQNSNTIMHQAGTAASAGTIDSYSFYTESPKFTYDNAPCRMAVYNSAGTSKIEDVAEFTTGTYGPGWYTVNSTSNAAITAADHRICIWADDGVDAVGTWVAYDLGSPTANFASETYGTLTAWPATLSSTSLGGILLSMYVTYSASATFTPFTRSQQYQPLLAQ